MGRLATTILCGLAGVAIGMTAVANYFVATQSPGCTRALAIILAVLYGAPAGFAAGVGLLLAVKGLLSRV